MATRPLLALIVALLCLPATVLSSSTAATSAAAAADEQGEQVCEAADADGGTGTCSTEEQQSNNHKNKNGDDVSIQMNVVEWIRDNGGYFNPKQEFQRVGNTSFFGIFATKDIAKGELVASIPWKCILTAGTDNWETYLYCDTIRYIVDEIHKGNESFYYPYLNYLQHHPPDAIPSMWSEEAKSLLKTIIGKRLPPRRATLWLDKYWRTECDGGNNLLEKQVVLQLVSRGDDDVLIPLYDLYNHRNGDKWYNTEPKSVEGYRHELYATRDIAKGEEVYNSYNHCTNCFNRYYDYGTPQIFRDYGFVEQYPQRWIFAKQDLAFDVDESETGELEVTWLDEDTDEKFGDLYEVTEAGIAELRSRLEHLKKLNETEIPHGLKAISSKLEAESIVSYYNALTTAIELGIEASASYINDDDDDDEDDEE